MSGVLSGRGPSRALVLGGASGIGAACSALLSSRGFVVDTASRRSPPEPGAFGGRHVELDISDARVADLSLEAYANDVGLLDVLVYSSGVFPPRRAIDDITVQDWDAVIATNLTGAFHALKTLLPALRAARGYVVLVGSVYASRGLRWGASYSASKHGLKGLLEALLEEWEDHGVRGTLISPGVVESPMTSGNQSSVKPLDPYDVARTVGWLLDLSPNASVREVRLERAELNRQDPEVQESSPAWMRRS